MKIKRFLNKKKTTSIFLILTLIGSSMLFGSTNAVDETLETASDITRKILNADIQEDEEKCGYISSYYVKGLDGAEDYIVSQCATGGYAIYEKESMELIEYSGIGNSPYAGVEKNGSYYAGPANYFKEKDGRMENLSTGKTWEKEDVENLAREVKGKLRTDREKRKEASETGLSKVKTTSQTDSLNSSDPTGGSTVDADSYTVKSRKYISDYQFFIDNDEHGYNGEWDGACTSVAAQLLLAYNNWSKDGRIITEQQIDGNEVFFLEGRDENKTKPYSDEMRGTTSSDVKYDDETSFYEILKGYINPTSFSDDTQPDDDEDSPENYDLGASIYDGYVGILNYIKKYAFNVLSDITIDHYEKEESGNDRVIDTLENEIDANRPAIASIYVYETQSDGTVKLSGHAIVVYGYQTIRYDSQDLNGFIAHYGWARKDTTNVWVNSSWFNGYLTFQTSHTHNNEIVLEEQNHVFECGECNAVYAKDNHIRNSASQLDTSDAFSSIYHTEECICGYVSRELHNYEYTCLNSVMHKAICKYCEYETLEYHFGKFDYCRYCFEPLE